jgi:hypothetical protein
LTDGGEATRRSAASDEEEARRDRFARLDLEMIALVVRSGTDDRIGRALPLRWKGNPWFEVERPSSLPSRDEAIEALVGTIADRARRARHDDAFTMVFVLAKGSWVGVGWRQPSR